MGFTKYSLMTTHQALVTCCHYVVDSILSSVSTLKAANSVFNISQYQLGRNDWPLIFALDKNLLDVPCMKTSDYSHHNVCACIRTDY